jgi:SAM-dependent methyltransferase
MLGYARQNAPGVEFVLEDARSFALPVSFDAVTCMFDSLNHVMSIDELRSAFRSVHGVVRGGGHFLLDLNLEAGYVARWNGVYGIVEDDHVCMVQNRYEPDTGVAVFEATLFRLQDGAWERSDFTLRQRSHPLGEVEAALSAAGFEDIRAFERNPGGRPRPVSEDTGKAFIICRKPAR